MPCKTLQMMCQPNKIARCQQPRYVPLNVCSWCESPQNIRIPFYLFIVRLNVTASSQV